jgi:hypothetical protein
MNMPYWSKYMDTFFGGWICDICDIVVLDGIHCPTCGSCPPDCDFNHDKYESYEFYDDWEEIE